MDILSYLKKGAFLTTICEDKVNTMTISWGNIGIEWGEDVFITLVRDSRFTNNYLDKNGKFSVTIPTDDSLKNELAFCGTKSGRDFDKIKECGFTLEKSDNFDVPHIKCNAIVVECEVMYFQRMDEANMSDSFKEKFYSSGDIHTLYHGKILNMYEVKCED